MVFKNISRIKASLPEILHIVMFYNNGTVYQTTFEQDINKPKLGENLTELLTHAKLIYEICKFKLDDYKKLVFETADISVIILKLGEDSNIALFFKKEEEKDIKISSIRRYLTRIEELIDMDEREILLQQILAKEDELKKKQEDLRSKQQDIQNLREELQQGEDNELQDKARKLGEIRSLDEDCERLQKDIENIYEEISKLRSIIEKE